MIEEEKRFTSDASSVANCKEEAVWCKEDQDFLLTYNIWHMLPWIERKDISMKYGCKSIGEFEEYMSIRRALEVEKKAYPNEEAYLDGIKMKNKVLEDVNSSATNEIFDKGELEQDESGGEIITDLHLEPNPDELLSNPDLIKVGGIILTLPEELVHYAFSFLSVDTFATLALVSPHWKHLCRTEAVYRKLCERIYLHQSKRRILKVLRFGSYRNMLYSRPRVRNGLYVMRYAQVKRIQRDMWCEVPAGAILETVYYRYIYFHEDGRVLYALTVSSPHEIIRRFLQVIRHGETDPTLVWGTFQVQGKVVTVTAKQEWQHVKLELGILPHSHWGRFGALTFDRHLTSPSGNFDEYAWPSDIHVYEVPSELFRYVYDRRFL